MDVFESVRQYYEEQIDWEPDIKREWVKGYLKQLQSRKAPTHKLKYAWKTISRFMLYQERSEHHDLVKLPFWEYSPCLLWLESHIGFKLNLAEARRFLLALLDFYEYLEAKGYSSDCQELRKAICSMCSAKSLRLVDRIPYTGEEFWTAVSSPNSSKATFTIKDFWLAMLYEENGSWRQLREEARKSVQPERMLEAIESFQRRLENVGYATPQRLALGDADYEDLAEAKRWFYRGKTPAIKWTGLRHFHKGKAV